jgi:hypothetical protein
MRWSFGDLRKAQYNHLRDGLNEVNHKTFSQDSWPEIRNKYLLNVSYTV